MLSNKEILEEIFDKFKDIKETAHKLHHDFVPLRYNQTGKFGTLKCRNCDTICDISIYYSGGYCFSRDGIMQILIEDISCEEIQIKDILE